MYFNTLSASFFVKEGGTCYGRALLFQVVHTNCVYKKTAGRISTITDLLLWFYQDSNLDLKFRKLPFYPLNYRTRAVHFLILYDSGTALL